MTCRPQNVKPEMALLQVTSSRQNGLLLQEEEPIEVPTEAVEQEMDLLLEVHELLGLAPASQLASDLPSSWAAMEQTSLRWVGQLANTSVVLHQAPAASQASRSLAGASIQYVAVAG